MKKSLEQILAALRREAGYTQPQVSALLAEEGIDIKAAGISKWEKGLTQPNASQFLALCKIYGVRDVMGAFEITPAAAPALNAEGRRLVLDYARVLTASGLYATEAPAAPPPRLLPLYALAASAGTGQFLDGDDHELTEVPDGVPGSAAFAVRIAGDSMEPEIPDGALVWLRRRETLENGKTGVFLYNGEAFCKRFTKKDGKILLVSSNKQYAPIRVTGELRVFGEVVAVT